MRPWKSFLCSLKRLFALIAWHRGRVANCILFFFNSKSVLCDRLQRKKKKPSLCNSSDQWDSKPELSLCCYYFNTALRAVSSLWRVFPASCLLPEQTGKAETRSGTPTRGLGLALQPSTSFLRWPRMSQLGEELPEGCLAVPVRLPSAQRGQACDQCVSKKHWDLQSD